MEIRDPAVEESHRDPDPKSIITLPAAANSRRVLLLAGVAVVVLLVSGLSLFFLAKGDTSSVNIPGSDSLPVSTVPTTVPSEPAADNAAAAVITIQHEESALPPATTTKEPQRDTAIVPAVDPFEPKIESNSTTLSALKQPGPESSPVVETEKTIPQSSRAAPTDKKVQSFLNQAYLYAQGDRYGQAITCYDKVLAIDPQQHDALVNRGIIKQNIGDVSGARHDLIAALEIGPGDPFVLNALGVLHLAAGEKDEATNCFLQAGDPTALINLALLYWQDREFGSVITTLIEAERRDAQDPFVPYYRGLFYRQQGNRAAAQDSFDKAVRLARKRGHTDLINRIEGLSGVH